MIPPSQHSPCICPACNRYSPPLRECPYCGLESPLWPHHRALRLSAVVLSITGLAILWLMGQQPPPRIPITGLRPVMNHGHVTLAGTVAAAPRINGAPAAPQSISFDLADNGGLVTILATQEIAQNLLTQNNLPDLHRAVQVTGHLYLAAGKPNRLYLDSAQSLHQLETAP